MRLLYARVGRTFCRNCGREVVRGTAEVVAAQLGALGPGTRLLIGFDLPIVEGDINAAEVVDEVGEQADDADAAGEGSRGSRGSSGSAGLSMAIKRDSCRARRCADEKRLPAGCS